MVFPSSNVFSEQHNIEKTWIAKFVDVLETVTRKCAHELGPRVENIMHSPGNVALLIFSFFVFFKYGNACEKCTVRMLLMNNNESQILIFIIVTTIILVALLFLTVDAALPDRTINPEPL